jgi:prevent-host-death family protein
LQVFVEVVMAMKFLEDLVPLTDLKSNPGRVVKHTTEVHRPVLLTSQGRGVAVVQSISDYEKAEEERVFMRAVVAGLADLEAGHEVSLDEARVRLGLK